MSRQVLFVQGGGAGAHDEWDNKLVESLRRELGPNFQIRYPRMPNEDDPRYAAWKEALEKEFDDAGRWRDPRRAFDRGDNTDQRAFGATTKAPVRCDHVDRGPLCRRGRLAKRGHATPARPGRATSGGVPVYIYHGLDDETAPPSHAELYARAIPQASVSRLPDRDHQLNNDLKEIAATITSLERGA